MNRHALSEVAALAVSQSAQPIVDFVERLPWPAIVVDDAGRVIRVNAAMRAYRAKPASGYGSLRDDFPEYWKELRGDPPWLTAQTAAIRRDGDRGPVQERLSVVAMPGGACLVVEDVSRLRQLEVADVQTARLASLGFMLAGACHELSNPLAALYSMVQILRASPKAQSEDVQKGLANVEHNVHRLLEISRRLVGFSRVDDAPRIVFPVDESVDEALVVLRQSGQLDEVDVVRETDPNAIVVGNQGQLEEVFYNVLLNAVQAMDGRGRLVIRTSQPSSQDVEVAIKDNGPGIPPKALARLFEPFFTTKPNGKGTGLGLPICNEIVSEHGGRVRVENDKDGGACFFIRLPAAGRTHA